MSEMQRKILLAVIGSIDGMSDADLQRHLRMDGNTERPRRVWLVRNGFLRDSGRKRPTKPGGKYLAAVWVWTGKQIGGPS